MKWMLTAFVLSIVPALSGAAAQGQATAQQQRAAQTNNAAAPESQFDIAGSFFRSFNNSSSGNGATQTPTDADGGMFEARYISNPFIGFEMSYSFNPDTETFAPKAGACGFTCKTPPTHLTTKVSVLGLNWVVSKKMGSLRPFALGGIGFLIDQPDFTIYPNNDIVRPAWIAGAGLDWSFTGHLGVRIQLRDDFYKAPNLTTLFPATGAWTQSVQPMAGVFYRF